MKNPLHNMLDKAFLEHPRLNGESYAQHMAFTLKYGAILLVTAFCLLVHGLIPGLFTHTASNKIKELNSIFEQRRNRTNYD
ncbi:MAG: DUF6356 family protein [Alphaproteobacteria bacterium]|nr:DUF6356 family protein [Alphaproteobacteria bacterium]